MQMRIWDDERKRPTRLAQGVAALILIAGISLIGLDAYRQRPFQ